MINNEHFLDDGSGNIHNGTIDYATGALSFNPDSETVFAVADLEWVKTGGSSNQVTWLTEEVTSIFSRVYKGIKYIPSASLYEGGDILCKYYSSDGVTSKEYTRTIAPIFPLKIDKTDIEVVPKSLSVKMGTTQLIDGGDGKLYSHVDGVAGAKVEVGSIDYVDKSFKITSDAIDISSATISFCSGTGAIEPVQSMVFRTPGSPVRPGSVFIKGTTGDGDVIEGTSDFNGDISGEGIIGTVNFNTGLCQVIFGEWVVDDAAAQASDWYKSEVNDDAGNVWKPFVVHASSMLINCVITSYLPLDAELLGLDPVRLPMDGKVPIFRDGYIIVVHNSTQEYMPYPLGTGTELPADTADISVGRTNVDLIEAYTVPTAKQISDGTQTVPMLIEETGNWTHDLVAGTIKFLSGYVYPMDADSTKNQIIALSRIEDMCLASDVQVTGHIAITSPLVHSYTSGDTMVSSVLPSADLQSRAYNEFEQNAWAYEWLDEVDGSPPLASYNFVDYPITVINQPSIKERWLILFQTSTTVQIIGENFGVLAENVSIGTGNAIVGGNDCIAIENRQFPGEYYFVIRCDGFGAGWQSGNCIRFNQDAANFPLWFVRTTLQAPPTEPIDHYTIQIRGDSS